MTESKKLNLFQAIGWMHANKGKRLIAQRHGREFDARMGPSSLDSKEKGANYWSIWSPDFLNADSYSFTVPERKLPEPPEGTRWVKDEDGARYIESKGSRYYVSRNEHKHAINKALVEEYETRPKEGV